MSLGCRCGIPSPNRNIFWILGTNFIVVVTAMHCLVFIIRCYQLSPILLPPCTYTASYPHPPSMKRSSFAYVHFCRKHILSQVTDVFTSPGSYAFLWL